MGFIKGREVERILILYFQVLSCDSTRISAYTQVFLNVGDPNKIRNDLISLCRREVCLSVFFFCASRSSVESSRSYTSSDYIKKIVFKKVLIQF